MLENKFSSEVFDMFSDQLIAQLPRIEEIVLDLDKNGIDNELLNELFRIFHSFKATASYLGLPGLRSLSEKTETVLSMLQKNSLQVSTDIIDWLFRVKDQFSQWSDEIELNANVLSESNLEKEINLTATKEPLSTSMKKLTLLYCDDDKTRAKTIIPVLKKMVGQVKYVSSFEELLKLSTDIDIVFTNIANDTPQYIKKVYKKFDKSALIVTLDKVTPTIKSKYALYGIHHIIKSPIKGDALKRELYAVTLSHFSERRVLISNKKIKEFIETLEPLPNTIFQIQQICDDSEMGISDLIKVVKQDPIISGTILNAANSPIYGLKKITSIDQAVATFGKRTIKAIALGEASKYIGIQNLECYGINDELFSSISNYRLSLMVKWYSKVAIADLSTLSVSAILGNIGQLLIAKEITRYAKIKEFQAVAKSESIQFAEESILHTTTAFVTSDILDYWNIQSEIVDSIRYSDNYKNAPIEIQHLCIANYVVFNLVHLNGTIKSEVPAKIAKLVEEHNMNLSALRKALEFIHDMK